ncbi:hypothetical protein AA21952_3515 [Acetobacter oeni LMG 21952]|nr:hypothetical protein AA21952_3515 [Acetobacter oeni LMG 21952]
MVAGAGLTQLPQARADTLPVVAVNREIGLSVTGTYRGTASNSSSYASLRPAGGGETSYYSDGSGRTRWSGWTPGFQADAQSMFDAFGIRNLYAAASFNLTDGNSDYRETYAGSSTYGRSIYRERGSANRSGINVTGELGKGFLLADNRLLITPTVQGGYFAGGVESLTFSGKGYVGLALHVDYAITDRLVIRARGGWAQVLQAEDTGASRPQWRGDIGLDYRLTQHLHLTGGVRYTYMQSTPALARMSQARVVSLAVTGPQIFDSSYHVRSWDNQVQLHLGMAYQF